MGSKMNLLNQPYLCIATMNYEYDDAWKADDTKMWSFKVKSGAGDAVSPIER